MMFLILFFFSLLIFNHFSANIISTLQSAKSIETVEELFNDHKDITVMFRTKDLNLCRLYYCEIHVKLRLFCLEKVDGFKDFDRVMDRICKLSLKGTVLKRRALSGLIFDINKNTVCTVQVRSRRKRDFVRRHKARQHILNIQRDGLQMQRK